MQQLSGRGCHTGAVSTLNRQAERSNRSTHALLDAAAELVAEGGLGAMTFAAIGERAGYSRGLVSARFGTKAGLVDALIRRVWRRLGAAGVVPMSHTSPAMASLLGLVDGLSRVAADHERDLRALSALVHQAASADPELRDRMMTFSEQMRVEIRRALERGMDDGSVRRDIDPRREAVAVVAVLNGVAYQWLLDAGRIDVAAAYATVRDLVADRYCVR